ncbi:cytochrome P450 [Leptodontidium sp. MPI-SDFR-AT-0119]|nr:cytochrome P450 [Leptodontidium sp. MPI-SDFR-AT-0119]
MNHTPSLVVLLSESSGYFPSSNLIFAFLGTLILSSPVPPGTGKEPPVASYWLPWFQHLFSFLRDPNGHFQSLGLYSGIPFTIPMMNTKFHVFSSPTAVATVFGKSREFIFPPVVASMMENGLNLPVPDRRFFNISISDKTNSAMFNQEAHNFVDQNHLIYLKYLANKRLDDIIAVYMNNFYSELDSAIDVASIGEEWREIQLHETMTKVIFETSTTTFFGNRIRKYWGENMWPDFRTWNDATYIGVRANFAYYFQPRAYFARNRMLRAFEKWVDCDTEDWEEDEGVWNEKWGCKMNWERERLARQFGFTHRGRACSQASFLFVVVTNAAPMATWFILCIIQSDQRLRKFRQAIQPLLLPQSGSNPNDLRFDMAKLKANPYIRGLWNEALRLGSASAAARVVSKDTELEGYVLRGGSVVLLPVGLLHFDEEVFPEPEKFIPERWVYDMPPDATEEQRAAAAQKQKKQSANFRAFGGGTGLCSGRFVAEQEILSAVATMLMLFDIELVGGEGFLLNPRTIGIMSPAKEPNIRIRKRKDPRACDA